MRHRARKFTEQREAIVQLTILALIVLQAAAHYVLTRAILAPAVEVILCVWILRGRVRWSMDSKRRNRLLIGLLVLMVVKARVAPIHLPARVVTQLTQMGYALSQYFLFVQLLLLLLRDPRRPLTQAWPWIGGSRAHLCWQLLSAGRGESRPALVVSECCDELRDSGRSVLRYESKSGRHAAAVECEDIRSGRVCC